MIDVIIPCFNAHKTLDKTLQSISIQSIKDKLNVLLVDDCSDKPYDEIVNSYKDSLNISVLRLKKNSGPGVAREEGMKATKNKYITFIDADDLFYSVDALKKLLDEIEEGYDYVNSFEYDQKRDKYLFLNGNVHGKIYRRSYIEKNDIHFATTKYHEDNYFNNYVLLSGAKIGEINGCTYYYSYNKESITNVDVDLFDSLKMYLDNMYGLLDLFKDRNIKNRTIRLIVEKYRYLRNIYFNLAKKQQKEFEELINQYDKEFMGYLSMNDMDFNEFLLFYTLEYIAK